MMLLAKEQACACARKTQRGAHTCSRTRTHLGVHVAVQHAQELLDRRTVAVHTIEAEVADDVVAHIHQRRVVDDEVQRIANRLVLFCG